MPRSRSWSRYLGAHGDEDVGALREAPLGLGEGTPGKAAEVAVEDMAVEGCERFGVDV